MPGIDCSNAQRRPYESSNRKISLVTEEMIIELMTIAVPQDKNGGLGRDLASLVGPIHLQPGCLGCRSFRSWPEENMLQIEARWTSREDLVRHLKSDTYKKLLLLMELSPAPPRVEFFTVADLHGLDMVRDARSPE